VRTDSERVELEHVLDDLFYLEVDLLLLHLQLHLLLRYLLDAADLLLHLHQRPALSPLPLPLHLQQLLGGLVLDQLLQLDLLHLQPADLGLQLEYLCSVAFGLLPLLVHVGFVLLDGLFPQLDAPLQLLDVRRA
jgi:hypothetical protein